MSFILDALKKSESDRQRQTGPALFEVKIAPPKARFPMWAIAIAALLGVNMVVVGWLLLRRPSHPEEVAATPPATSATAAPMTGTNSPTPARAPTPVPAAASNFAPPPVTAAPQNNPPPPAPAQTRTADQTRPTDQTVPPGAASTARDGNEPTLAGATPPAPGTNPDDYVPASEQPTAGSLFKGHVRRGTESGFVLYQDAALVPGANLPQLRLDLHVYAAKPQDRFALINMHRMHEGDSLPDGVRVEIITPDGVVMSHNGSKFLLPRD